MQISAENLVCRRGNRIVFSDLSFTVAQGEGLLIEGPNGAGKTSLLRILAGLGAVERGTLRMSGVDDELASGRLSHYLGHRNALKHAMTVEENLAFWAGFMGRPASSDAIARHLGAFGLDRLRSCSAGLLSDGQRRRLALSRLELVARPVWLLDEPSVGLDAASRRSLTEVMKRHVSGGGLLIASTHTDLDMSFTHRIDLGRRAEHAS